MLLLLVAGALAGYRLIAGRHAQPTAPEKPAALAWSGDKVTVPKNSPVRARLVVAPVAQREFHRDLDLPAAVISSSKELRRAGFSARRTARIARQ